jgi:hypothetical protein
MATRVTLASDDFNRADSGDLGGNWVEGYAAGGFGINSNRAAAGAAGINVAAHTSITLPNDQWCSVEIVADVWPVALVLRMPPPTTFNGYLLYFNAAGTAAEIYREDAGTPTLLATGSLGAVNGDTIRFEVEGLVLAGYVGLARVVTYDAGGDGTTYTAGDSGLYAGNGVFVDNFACGDFVSPLLTVLRAHSGSRFD